MSVLFNLKWHRGTHLLDLNNYKLSEFILNGIIFFDLSV